MSLKLWVWGWSSASVNQTARASAQAPLPPLMLVLDPKADTVVVLLALGLLGAAHPADWLVHAHLNSYGLSSRRCAQAPAAAGVGLLGLDRVASFRRRPEGWCGNGLLAPLTRGGAAPPSPPCRATRAPARTEAPSAAPDPPHRHLDLAGQDALTGRRWRVRQPPPASTGRPPVRDPRDRGCYGASASRRYSRQAFGANALKVVLLSSRSRGPPTAVGCWRCAG